MRSTLLLLVMSLALLQQACGNDGPKDFEQDTGSSGDADTDGDSDTDTDGDADGDADTDADSDADGDADTDADSDADTDADSDADTDADSDADTDADSDADTDADSDADTDADGDADTDADTDSDTDADTGTYDNPCADPNHAGCYGNDVWCLDDGDTPVSPLDTCTGGEQCVVQSPVFAECLCVGDWTEDCYNDDAWAYDSCGAFDHIIDDCTGTEVCTILPDSSAACCDDESYQACNDDENVHWYDTCDQESSLVDDCPDNADCVETSATEAECQCRNLWEGTDCETCPTGYDPTTDCFECATYYSGDNCETCSGYGVNCNCPDNTYTYWPDGPTAFQCWTCELPVDAVLATCEQQSSVEYTWSQAGAACPTGFRIPTVDELLSTLDNCADVGDEIHCDTCSNSTACNAMWPGAISGVWSADECGSGKHWLVNVSLGIAYFSGLCVNDTETFDAVCVR